MRYLLLALVMLVLLPGGAGAMSKVTICHIPPGNPENAHTIEVGEPAVPAHLAHGDTLGDCEEPPTVGVPVTVTPEPTVDLEPAVTPEPTTPRTDTSSTFELPAELPRAGRTH